jgi:hypothetical protein
VSPAIGALAATAPAGTAVLAGGLAGGRLVRQTAVGCLISYAALRPIVRRVHGEDAGRVADSIVTVLVAKRLAGNARVQGPGRGRAYASRLIFDRDRSPTATATGDVSRWLRSRARAG